MAMIAAADVPMLTLILLIIDADAKMLMLMLMMPLLLIIQRDSAAIDALMHAFMLMPCRHAAAMLPLMLPPCRLRFHYAIIINIITPLRRHY